MNWTRPADLRARVQGMWDKGQLLACLAGAPPLFPKRLPLKGPTASELPDRFTEVRSWIDRLRREARHYRLEWRRVNHRVLGANDLPSEIWIDTLEDALALIGRRREAERFSDVVATARQRLPGLVGWLRKRPLRALSLADDWSRLLDTVDWLLRHPRPNLYLRQVDIPGVHSKFLEAHRGVLYELFEEMLPPSAVDASAVGAAGFCRRYGFRERPLRVRFRVLDPAVPVFSTRTDQDIAVTHDTFARLDWPVQRVFITENEINFLAFPPVTRGMVVFGAGYGFDRLAQARWLEDLDIYYWGDIDTHGFAILDQLRAHFPRAASLLMDRPTLMVHREHWGEEPCPETRDLPRLTAEEAALYDDLRRGRLGVGLRLEQERIGFEWVQKGIAGALRWP